MHMQLFAGTNTNTHVCMYSCLQLRGTPLQLWCGSRRRHKRQAGWWKWLVCVNYSSGCQCAPLWDRTHTSRVQVNIHVIAMKQLLGKIRSVITGLKIKWEFFISGATCYSTNRADRHINEGRQRTDGGNNSIELLVQDLNWIRWACFSAIHY